MAELESPGQCDSGTIPAADAVKADGIPIAVANLPPQNAAEPHPAHEHDDECGEPPGAHPFGQRQLRGDLQRRENRDPGYARGQHRRHEEREVLHVREGQGGERVQRACAATSASRETFVRTRGRTMAPANRADSDARQQDAVDLRTAPSSCARSKEKATMSRLRTKRIRRRE